MNLLPYVAVLHLVSFNVHPYKLFCFIQGKYVAIHRVKIKLHYTDFYYYCRLDMCRRQYANDVCNRGTAGRLLYMSFRNLTEKLVS